jgi:hypothetical protein
MADIKISQLNAAVQSNLTDLFETSQSDGMGGWVTKKATLNQMLANVYSTAQAIYINPNGSDTTGNGSENNPYQTYAHAASVAILTASESNPFVIIPIGIFNITGNITLYPFVTISGYNTQASQLNVTGAVLLDSTFDTMTNAFCHISNLGLYAQSNITLTLTVAKNQRIHFDSVDFAQTSTISATGVTGTELFLFENCLSTSTPNIVFTDILGAISNSTMNSVSSYNTGVGDNLLVLTSSTATLNSLNLITSGANTQTSIISGIVVSSLSLSGANNAVNIDVSSYSATPSFSGGANINNITIRNLSDGLNASANFTPTNYTPSGTSNYLASSVTGHLSGINNALSSSGMAKVEVTTGYVEVAPNTIYYTRSAGRVVFQTPATFPKGAIFQIVGSSESQIGWEVWTQLGQNLIYQDLYTAPTYNQYVVAYSNYYRDTATFMCIENNTQFECIQYDGAGLQINQINAVDSYIPSVTSLPLIIGALAKVVSTYNGYLVKAIRNSDGAVSYVLPDFAGRASLVSQIDVGGTLADWALGSDIDAQFMDQSFNGYNFINSGQCRWIDFDGTVYNINGVPTVRTGAGAKYMQAAFPSDYIIPTLTVIAMGARNDLSYQSSFVTLYDPVNGDDFSSSLNNVAFYEDNPTAQDISVRNGNLSVKSRPNTLNTQMVLANRFDGTNNIMTIDKVDGTTVASSGDFGFNKFLVGARYVSGGITAIGDYKIGLVALYPSALSLSEISDITDYINAYL